MQFREISALSNGGHGVLLGIKIMAPWYHVLIHPPAAKGLLIFHSVNRAPVHNDRHTRAKRGVHLAYHVTIAWEGSKTIFNDTWMSLPLGHLQYLVGGLNPSENY